MRVAVLREVGRPLAIEDWPSPVPRGDEVLVRVAGAGVCHTDVHIQDGLMEVPLPLVLGHEIAGTADGYGPVVVGGSWGDGTCPLCRRGDDPLCPAAAEPGLARHGGYAEAVVVPSPRFLVPLTSRLDPVRAAPLADAGVTPYRAVRRATPWLAAGGVAVVLGCGGLGQFGVQYLARLPGVRVVAVDPVPGKRALALDLGADDVAHPDDDLPPARAVIDFVGSDDSLARAARTVERGGLVVMVGEAGGRLSVGTGTDVPWEATFTTSVLGSLQDLREVVALAEAGELGWSVETLPLDRADEALARVRRGDVAGRLVLTP
jgi:alcohol dehydrogenase, propanol-preferring